MVSLALALALGTRELGQSLEPFLDSPRELEFTDDKIGWSFPEFSFSTIFFGDRQDYIF